MIVTGSTLDLSKQAELTNITDAQIDDLSEGSAILYKRDDKYKDQFGNNIPVLGFIRKDGTITDMPYPGTEIKRTTVPPLPTTFPGTNKAYALGLVEVFGDFKLKWVLVDTVGNFNQNPPSEYYLTVNPATCYNYDPTISYDLFLNGSIVIYIYGWDVNTPKKYSLDGGSNFSGIVTEGYDGGLSFFAIQNLGNTNPTGQTIDLVIADSYDYVLFEDTVIVDSPVYEVLSSYEGLDNNGAFAVNLIKEQDNSLSTIGSMKVVVSDVQVGCEYYYEVFDYNTSLLLFDQNYSQAKEFKFEVSSTMMTLPDTRIYVAVTKKTPGRIRIEGIDSNGDTIKDIEHYSLLYSKGNPDPDTFVNITPGTNYTDVTYAANEAEGEKKLYMKLYGYDCIYIKVTNFIQAGNSTTTTDMLMLEYTGETIDRNSFDIPSVGGVPLNPLPVNTNTYFNPTKILTGMFGGGSDLTFSYIFLNTVIPGGDVAEILFYDAISGQPATVSTTILPTISTTGNVSMDVKSYDTYRSANPSQILMFRFKYFSSFTGRTYYSDLLYIQN